MSTTEYEYESELIVAARAEESEGVVSLTLRHPSGGELPAWEPGAHIDLFLNPRNNFALLPAARYLFVAGGIGITPILPMIAAEAAGADWALLYGGRTRGSMAFTRRLAAYGVKVTVAPADETGLLDLASYLVDPTPDTRVYCCGPEPPLNAAEAQCGTWPTGVLHVERFTARAADPEAASDAFELELARSGLTLTVAAGRSILRTVEDAGVPVLYSCTEGTCGTCETDIVEARRTTATRCSPPRNRRPTSRC